jgi:DNA-directed RNA polymerase subunit RPC12/RpoP
MLKDNIDCPTCESISKLGEDHWSGFSNSPKITFFYKSLVYSCDNCGGKFTTNESDEITMGYYYIEKRKEIIKYKINKLSEHLW